MGEAAELTGTVSSSQTSASVVSRDHWHSNQHGLANLYPFFSRDTFYDIRREGIVRQRVWRLVAPSSDPRGRQRSREVCVALLQDDEEPNLS